MFKIGNYNPDVRVFEALSTSNQEQLEQMMSQIKEWVYDSASEKRLSFTIKSIGLRKQLDKQVKKEYMNSGMFFNWSRTSQECHVEKTKKFKQKDYLRGFAKINVARDQEKVANLGFFDESEDEKERKDAPLDPLFSQSAVVEESKDQVMSETEE